MPRARRGAGSIRQRKDGRWVAEIALGYENGARRRVFVYGATLAEARDKALLVQQKRAAGENAKPSTTSVAAFLDRYLEHVKSQLRSQTYEDYDRQIRLHVRERLGRHKLAKLRPADIEALYLQLRRDGVGARTIRKVHAILRAACEYGVRMDELPRNPVARVTAPAYRPAEMRPFSLAQARRFVSAIAGDRFEALYLLAIYSGMREGELFGLQLDDLDLENGALYLRRSVERDVKGQRRLSGTKTESSRRRIALPAAVVAALRAHRQGVLDREIETTYVFPDAKGGALSRHNFPRRHFYPLLELAELPRIRMHDLRHSFASLMLALGTHPKVVQEILGHSRISTTLDTYSHVIPAMTGAAIDDLARELEGKPRRIVAGQIGRSASRRRK